MATEIQIELNNIDAVLDYFRRAPEQARRLFVTARRRGAVMLERFAKEEAPVNDGILRSGIFTREAGDSSFIAPKAPYALAVHEDTKPHWPPIKAFTGKEEPLDKWARKHGVPAFAVARGIALHGTKPNRFMSRAAERGRQPILALFDNALDQLVEEL